MINLQFNIRNPFSDRWKCIKCWDKKLSEHKHLELQIDKTADIVSFDFRYTIRQDHAGLFLTVGLFGYEAIFNIYDTRHWNYEERRWYKYGENNGWND